jgi:transposase
MGEATDESEARRQGARVASLLVVVGSLEAPPGEARGAENVELRAEVADLRARLGQNSSNSSKPPSSDSPADRGARPGKPPSGRKRGGQPGHKGSQRQLLTPTKPPVDCFPAFCRRCEKHLPALPDPDPRRHQTVDLPAIVQRVPRVVDLCDLADMGRMNGSSFWEGAIGSSPGKTSAVSGLRPS